MAEHTIITSEDQEKAGVLILGSTEAVTRELQAIADSTMGPWVKKMVEDQAAVAESEATVLKSKYDKLDAAKKAAVDAIIATAVQAPGDEEPLEDPTP
jgi:hypothetical protein